MKINGFTESVDFIYCWLNDEIVVKFEFYREIKNDAVNSKDIININSRDSYITAQKNNITLV